MNDWGYRLATLNSILNGTAAILLFAGWRAIRLKKIQVHRAFMLSAFVVSCLFLISYLTRVFSFGSRPYPGMGLDRTFYLALLASHVVLAALVPFLALIAIYWAWRGNFLKHRKVAKITFPLWIYVSVTGVAIYLMLYHFA